MKKIALFLFLFGFLSACEYEDPSIYGYSNFKFGKLEGKTLNASFDVTVENPNTFGFKVKKGDLNLFLNDVEMGQVLLTDKLKVQKKSEKQYRVPVKLQLKDGVLLKLPKLLTASSFKLELKGKIRASAFGFGKTVQVHETKNVSKSDVQFEGF